MRKGESGEASPLGFGAIVVTMEPRLSYRERPAGAPLRGLGLCFWELAAPRAYPHVVFPDGCCALIYRRGPALPRAGLRVMGPTLRPRRMALWAGDRFWGLRLQPAACRAVLGVFPAALRDQAVDFELLAPARAAALMAALGRQTQFAAAAGAFSAQVRSWEPAASHIDPVAAAAARAIAAGGGAVRIADIAKDIAAVCGQRQLERRFYRAVGLTPKEFARARRMRAIAAALTVNRGPGWAEFAAANGFADQAHLVREVGVTTGQRPRQFARHVRAFAADLLPAQDVENLQDR